MRKGLKVLLASLTASPLFLSEMGAGFVDTAMARVEAQQDVIAKAEAEMAQMGDDYWPAADSWLAAYRPYIVENGILTIPVDGLLVNKLGYCIPGWMTGYQYIQRAFDRGLADGNVRGIAFVIDSPGGMASGNFELVDHIFENRGEKPMRAYASDSCYSAAYSIATAADSITVSRSGGVGSVGVITAHVDISGALERQGIKITTVYRGKHKIDGTPYEGLTEQARERMEARVDKLYVEFVSTVARNRDMAEEEVRATEALTYDAEDALAVGFADNIGQASASIIGFAQEIETGEEQMSNTNGNRTGQAPAAGNEDAANLARSEGLAEGMTAGQKAERERMSAILTSDEGKARPKAAMAALATNMTAAEAVGFLGQLPTEAPQAAAEPAPVQAATEPAPVQAAAPAKGGDHFSAHMDASKQPGVGAGDSPENMAQEPLNELMTAYTAHTGFSFKGPTAVQ